MSLMKQMVKLLERAYQRIAELEKENKEMKAWIERLTK